VKRDKDLIRELLFQCEQAEEWLHMLEGDTLGASLEERRRGYHVELMMDEGLLAPVGAGTYRVTSFGHDYLDAIRSDTVWTKTKAGAAQVGGMTLGMIKELAVAYVKQEAAEKLGIKL